MTFLSGLIQTPETLSQWENGGLSDHDIGTTSSALCTISTTFQFAVYASSEDFQTVRNANTMWESYPPQDPEDTGVIDQIRKLDCLR